MAELVQAQADSIVRKVVEVVGATVGQIIATVKRTTRSGPSSDQQEVLRPEAMSLNSYALLQAYIFMAVTGLGYLALTWSTVVLLGGFVTSLGAKDFWCLTTISMVQAARIFNESRDNLLPIFLRLIEKLVRKVIANPIQVFLQKVDGRGTGHSIGTVLWVQSALVVVQLLSIPGLVAVVITGIMYALGPFSCIVISVWRISQRDFIITDSDGSKSNLVPALYIFYSLVICQGVLFLLWYIIGHAAIWIVVSFRKQCRLPEKWGSVTVAQYLSDTQAKCGQDPASVSGRNLIDYAVELVGSKSHKDYLLGARMLGTFIRLHVDVRSLLLPSRLKIQKLIDTLGWRSSSDREIREPVARIVAYLAGDIHLSQFPGAIRCISSLLDTTLPYWSNNHHSPHTVHSNVAGTSNLSLEGVGQGRPKGERDHEGDARHNEVDKSSIHGSDWNELILQGLAILERLALDQHNCRDICSTPGLLPKIMAALYSRSLIQNVNASACWADVVNGSLKVVHRLIRAPGRTGRRLRRDIASSKQAVINLEGILDQSNNELQMRAIEILAELAFDVHTNLSRETKENIIEKQTQIFLTDEEESATTESIELKVAAGKALRLLSDTELLSQTGSISVFMRSKYSYIVHRLTGILDARNKVTYRTIAAEILENLCTQHTMDSEHMKNTLLPKVFTEVLTSKRGPENKIPTPGNDAENRELTVKGIDEENQIRGHNSQIKSSSQGNNEHTATTEFQEAFLSLAVTICNRLMISARDFDDVAQEIPHEDSEVVAMLKAIVEENCEATADCLRVVKLCGEIAILMMQRSEYITHFKGQQFVQSLSKAFKNMSNLESCILFAGTGCGAKKTVEPLLFDLEKEILELVG